ECFCPSCFPTTRENTQFSKNTFPRPQKLVFKPSEFLDFVSEPKNKPRLKVLKRGLIFKTIFQKRGLCNGYQCCMPVLFLFIFCKRWGIHNLTQVLYCASVLSVLT